MPKLENWSVVAIGADPYLTPEAQPRGLHGVVSEDERFSDGEFITTSKIIAVRLAVTNCTDFGDPIFVTTKSGTEYILGAVDPEWEKLYPNARERFIASWVGKKVKDE